MKKLRKIFIYAFNPYTYFTELGMELRRDNYTKIVYYKTEYKIRNEISTHWVIL
jgi:hypothetical protein